VITYGNGTKIAETDYSYDQTAVASVSNLPANSHDETNYPTSYNNRGNLTTVTEKCFYRLFGIAMTPWAASLISGSSVDLHGVRMYSRFLIPTT